ncbi:hypothetical protein FWK45_01980 [Histophilus somni]|nr:hypothetical protein [Histophilus somni]QEH11957.1 hypothetical protein FWK44_01980 [Histophilus somni]QEH26438.1 hypothetical protein FWK62_01995 [Histophilus somni]QEH50625.1 hypothetical protein FWK45_01980 [Histophilus somni]QQF66073.1 hypothetical protein JFL60_01995 [Histophilus somni]QQF70814.1 hypothetical protein JFL59_01995 [Histophilus somni]
MTTYQDLCKKYCEYNVTVYERGNKIKHIAQDLMSALETDLELKGKDYQIEFNSERRRDYVNIINLENKEDISPFQLKSIFDEKSNPTIQFGLEIVLEKQIGAYPKTPVHLPISITYQSDREVAIEFTSTSKPAKFIVSLNEDKPYKDVIEAYKQIILSFFSV